EVLCMRKTRQRWLVSLAMVAPLAFAAGCSGGAGDGAADAGGDASVLGTPEQQQAFDDLYNEAIDNGEFTVTVYGPPPAQSVLDAFHARFGDVEVVFEQLQSQDRITRLQAEEASGNRVGDVASDGRTPIIQMAQDGWCQPFEPIIDIPDELISMDGQALTPYNTMFGLLINTDLIDPADAPTTWEEIVDPKWKGKQVMVSPAAGGAGAYLNAQLLTPEANADEWGMPVVEALKDNVTVVSKDAQTISSVVDGTYPIGVLAYYPYYFETLASTPDAPVEFLLIDDGTPYSVAKTCMIADAPNPHTAQLWMNWVMSEEGQTAYAAAGSYPSMPGMPGPEGLPGTDEITLLPQLSDEESLTGYVDYVQQIQEMYGG
ncbi:MAG: ABC transporter substrate-binding protein, partial [Pseudoclavibacter sp.]